MTLGIRTGDLVEIDLDSLWGEGGKALAVLSGYDYSGGLSFDFVEPATWYNTERDGVYLTPYQHSAVKVLRSLDLEGDYLPGLRALGFMTVSRAAVQKALGR